MGAYGPQSTVYYREASIKNREASIKILVSRYQYQEASSIPFTSHFSPMSSVPSSVILHPCHVLIFLDNISLFEIHHSIFEIVFTARSSFYFSLFTFSPSPVFGLLSFNRHQTVSVRLFTSYFSLLTFSSISRLRSSVLFSSGIRHPTNYILHFLVL